MKKVYVVNIGEKIANRAEIVVIENRHVELKYEDGHIQTLDMPLEGKALEASKKGTQISSKDRVTSDSSPLAKYDGIVEKNKNEFEVDSQVVEEALSDWGTLFRDIRAVPHYSDGNIDGFKIFNIQPNSVFSKIGLKNGDVLHKVNGIPIDSVERSLQLFEEYKDATSLTLEVKRGDRIETLNYSLRR